MTKTNPTVNRNLRARASQEGLTDRLARIARLTNRFRDPKSSTLDRLDDVASAIADLDAIAHVLAKRARTEGKTWGEIGAALGITKQAAHLRYGDRKPTSHENPNDVPLPLSE